MRVFEKEIIHTMALKDMIQAKIGENLLAIMSKENLDIAMIEKFDDPHREKIDQLVFYNKWMRKKLDEVLGFFEKLEKLLGDE